MTDVRVASFNIRTSTGHDGTDRWLLRRRAALTAIDRLDADVIGLQEVRAGQLRAIRRAFPDRAAVGAGRDAGGGGGEHATVVVRPPWTVESTRTRWLSPTPDAPGSIGWDAGHPRIATLVVLRNGVHRLGVVDTHLDHVGERARRHGAQLIVDWTRAEPEQPWVVLGDLNATPDSPAVRTFVEAGFVDALHDVPGGTEHAFTGDVHRQRIDYVLAGPGISVCSARIDTRRVGRRLPSDHWPVVADLTF